MRSLRGRGARAEGPVVAIADDHVRRADGTYVAVLRTSLCDAATLDDTAAVRLYGAMAALAESLTTPFQLLLRTRPWQPPDTVAINPWHAAMTHHARGHIVRHRPLRHAVFAIVSAATRQELGWRAETVTRALDGAGVAAERLCGDGLQALYAPLLSPWHLTPRDVATDAVFTRGFLLRRFPGADVETGWLHPVLTAPVTLDVAIHIRPVAAADALAVLRRRLRDELSQQIGDDSAGRVQDIRTDIAVDGIEALRTRLAANQSRALEVAVVCVVQAPTRDALERSADALTSAWAMTSARAGVTHLRHDAALLAVLPLADNRIGGWKLCDSGAAATLVPWAQVLLDDAAGYRLGHGRRDHAPLTLDPFATSATGNANVAVMAASGHGKSFTVSALMIEARRRARDVIVLDPEGEYRTVAAALGGTYIDVAPGSGASLNIFATGLNAAETCAAVAELAGLLCGGIDPTERAVLEAAAQTCLESTGPGTESVLADLLPALDTTAPRVHGVLVRHCRGPHAELLSRPTGIPNPIPPFLAIGYRDVPRDLMPAVTYIVAQWLWTVIRRDRRPRHVVVDEVGLLLEHAELRHLLVQLARRCRKYSASLVVATQNAGDLLTAPDVTVIPTNAATILLGGQRAADVRVMTAAFGLTQAQARFLESARRGEFLLISGSRRVEMEVDVPPEYHDLIVGSGIVRSVSSER